MGHCECCDGRYSRLTKGLCRRCYSYFCRNSIDINDDNFKQYSELFKILECVDKRPLTKIEIRLILDSIENGVLNKIPYGFWTGPYSQNNAVTSLDVWLIDVLKVDLNNGGRVNLHDTLKDSPISNLVQNGIFSLKELLSEVRDLHSA